MSKTIWVLNTNWRGNGSIDKYTVVYENKTYYYCKVSGTDQLKEFRKSYIENGEKIIVNNGEHPDTLPTSVLKDRLADMEQKKLEAAIVAKVSHIEYAERDIQNDKRKLDEWRKQLADMKTKQTNI